MRRIDLEFGLVCRKVIERIVPRSGFAWRLSDWTRARACRLGCTKDAKPVTLVVGHNQPRFIQLRAVVRSRPGGCHSRRHRELVTSNGSQTMAAIEVS